MARVLASRRKIAINAQLLRLSTGYRSAGISRYIQNILCSLPQIAPDLELHAFTGERRTRGPSTGLHFHFNRWPTGSPIGRILWEQLIWPFVLGNHYDLAHSMAFVSPLISHAPSIVTVYDLSFELYGGYFRPLNRFYLRVGTRRSVARARRVIAISESTRRDLVRIYGVSEDKIDVVRPGIEEEFLIDRTFAELDAFRRRRHLPEHFVLFVGTLEPRKNIPTLIRAFLRARRGHRLPHQLILIGGRGWLSEDIDRTIEHEGASDEVRVEGFVPQAELPLWYRAADAFVYPSQYEGFGMPPLEALAAGTPVVTSNVSSLPEAVGDAALRVDPSSEDELEDALLRVLTDESVREELERNGPIHARQYRWPTAAAATAEVYRRALGRSAQNKERR